jgi:hypothetical protein
MKTILVLIVFAMLSSGCSFLPRSHAIPDPSIPHRVATETTVEIRVRLPNGTFVTERVRLLEGWWVASPQVVEVR